MPRDVAEVRSEMNDANRQEDLYPRGYIVGSLRTAFSRFQGLKERHTTSFWLQLLVVRV